MRSINKDKCASWRQKNHQNDKRNPRRRPPHGKKTQLIIDRGRLVGLENFESKKLRCRFSFLYSSLSIFSSMLGIGVNSCVDDPVVAWDCYLDGMEWNGMDGDIMVA